MESFDGCYYMVLKACTRTVKGKTSILKNSTLVELVRFGLRLHSSVASRLREG
jgi:hypothetical protein